MCVCVYIYVYIYIYSVPAPPPFFRRAGPEAHRRVRRYIYTHIDIVNLSFARVFLTRRSRSASPSPLRCSAAPRPSRTWCLRTPPPSWAPGSMSWQRRRWVAFHYTCISNLILRIHLVIYIFPYILRLLKNAPAELGTWQYVVAKERARSNLAAILIRFIFTFISELIVRVHIVIHIRIRSYTHLVPPFAAAELGTWQ